jgi:putative ABC transport system permease protein
MSVFFTAIEQSLLLLPLVFGMYISYRILKVTDLTVDGTYVLGASVFAVFIDQGIIIALGLSILAGIIIGIFVALMQRHNRVGDLLVGILASFMLYSVNLQVMGRPNISLIGKSTIISQIGISEWVFPLIVINFLLAYALMYLLKSQLGLALRAFGYNQKLLLTLGKPVELYRILGLIISNSLAALSGALTAQVNGFADVNMGIGVALISIGAVVIGTHLFLNQKNFHVVKDLISCFLGISLYFFCLNILLKIGVNPANLKFLLGLMLFFTLRQMQGKSRS